MITESPTNKPSYGAEKMASEVLPGVLDGVLKYDQLKHHLKCALKALQKYKADYSNYLIELKFLTQHTDTRLPIPVDRDRDISGIPKKLEENL
jgi:hypothetical protein